MIFIFKKFHHTVYSISKMICQKQFRTFAGKYENFEDIHKIPRNMKNKDELIDDREDKIKYRNKDKRLSYKNRRSMNKDFKDFQNTEYICMN